MVIKVLGSGRSECTALESLVREAASQLGVEVDVFSVTDLAVIASHGIRSTPALVIDGKVVLAGGTPSFEKVITAVNRAR